MSKRIPTYGGRYPVWLWPATSPKTWRSILDLAGRGDVVLVVDVPADRVLISDFDEWHAVLNGWHGSPTLCPACGTVLCFEHYEESDPDPEVHGLGGGRRRRLSDAEVVWRETPGWDGMLDRRRNTRASLQATTEVVRAEWVVAAFVPGLLRRRRR